MDDSRRSFLQRTALGLAASTTGSAEQQKPHASQAMPHSTVEYPRVFTGRNLKMIAFPLGGIGAGSVSLGGRGQLRDWQIFNRADKGNHLSYALPSIWVQSGNAKPVARVLEARYEPPYEGENGLGSENAPGLSRLASARFTGEYPFAQIDFEDPALPVHVALEAFTPIVPHEPDDSGLPVAILRYRVKNSGSQGARVSVAWSIQNPVAPDPRRQDQRTNEYRSRDQLSGFLMTNPGLPETDLFHGSFVLAVRNQGSGKLTRLQGWPKGRWWNSALLFWDDFSSDGELGPEPVQPSPIGALCLSRTIPAGKADTFEFIIAWHFPNRTPARCGWTAPHGEENTVIGNWYATRFSDAWEAAAYAAANLERLEAHARLFGRCLRESTLPAAVREAASANLSTLATPTCFRTADGEFHGFEGINDKAGCCFGNCTHVWNYEVTTTFLFPSFARSLRKSAFGFSMDDAGAMHFRQLLPDGKERSGFAAADGQMGQIVHAYLDWILSGDREWLENLWPLLKKALAFAWVPGGWDANRDGVMEGVQHNTYDVEFYGPNPQCGIYYLAALRASEEMANALGDSAFATQCRGLYQSGSRWIDANLFNGNFYIQQIHPYRNDQIAPSLRSSMGAEDPEHPEYQVGKGCLVDQLIGQYLAYIGGLGLLLDSGHIRQTLASIYRFNYKPTLYTHDCVERTFALNDESALVICDYATAPRPKIPFPYFAEVMTGFEYSAAIAMLYAGMHREGIECIESIRRRYDGERRNPWDEAECGHHYARAMAAWAGIIALSGFYYHGGRQHLALLPPDAPPHFQCFWSNATGWGMFYRTRQQVRVILHHGKLRVRSLEFESGAGRTRVIYNGRPLGHRVQRAGNTVTTLLDQPVQLNEGEQLSVEISA
ncbi:MAG TPA: GH116 family glycosyl-hydrolase [Bryobacteraceae bacterium]|nr:GH116 family glycosyl-hydrolase [Bryobacteraceae bacterium]